MFELKNITFVRMVHSVNELTHSIWEYFHGIAAGKKGAAQLAKARAAISQFNANNPDLLGETVQSAFKIVRFMLKHADDRIFVFERKDVNDIKMNRDSFAALIKTYFPEHQLPEKFSQLTQDQKYLLASVTPSILASVLDPKIILHNAFLGGELENKAAELEYDGFQEQAHRLHKKVIAAQQRGDSDLIRQVEAEAGKALSAIKRKNELFAMKHELWTLLQACKAAEVHSREPVVLMGAAHNPAETIEACGLGLNIAKTLRLFPQGRKVEQFQRFSAGTSLLEQKQACLELLAQLTSVEEGYSALFPQCQLRGREPFYESPKNTALIAVVNKKSKSNGVGFYQASKEPSPAADTQKTLERVEQEPKITAVAFPVKIPFEWSKLVVGACRSAGHGGLRGFSKGMSPTSKRLQNAIYYPLLFAFYTAYYMFVASKNDSDEAEPRFCNSAFNAGFSVAYLGALETALSVASSALWKMGNYLSSPKSDKTRRSKQAKNNKPSWLSEKTGNVLKMGSQIIPSLSYGLLDVYQSGATVFFTSMVAGSASEWTVKTITTACRGR